MKNPMHVQDARFVASATDASQLPPPAFAEVAFAGRSNVGKSSLINALLERRKLVRTSATPGCTRGINIFRVTLGDGVFDLVDLPGYGYAKRSKAERESWGPLIEGFLRTRPGLRAVVIIVDVRRGLEEDDVQLLDFVRHVDREPLLVATKLDKLAASKRKPALAALQKQSDLRVHGFSAVSGEGRDKLLHSVLRSAAMLPEPR